jgi:metal-dependent amidase/aminoacylase/carboxypeptidase family protein
MIRTEEILTLSARLSGIFWKLSNTLADAPEISSQEYNASNLHAETLKQFGFTVEKPFADSETAFRATYGQGRLNFAFLVEYDALEGIGHGCGHNLSGAMTSLAAVLLSFLSSSLPPFRITVFGTPSEEKGNFKAHLVTEGHFSETNLALMSHATSGKSRAHFRSLAMSTRDFSFVEGKKKPIWGQIKGPNPLGAMGDLITTLEKLQEHGPLANGVILKCGKDPLETLSETTARFAFCSTKKIKIDDFLEELYQAAYQIAEKRNLIFVHKITERDIWEFFPNKPAEDALFEVMTSLQMDPEKFPPGEFDGASDVGNVSQVCPTVHPLISISGGKIKRHTPEFAAATKTKEARSALVKGAAALALLVVRFLSDEALQRKIKEHFTKERKL